MEKGKLYISCGVPGSGKTTYLNKIKKDDEVVISRDDIRFSILKEGEDYFSHEDEVFNLFVKKITEAINSGINVYADATHLNRASRAKLTRAIRNANCTPSAIETIFFNVPLHICLERNNKREGTKAFVPKGVIKRMFFTLEPPSGEYSKGWVIDEKGEVSKII